MVFEKLPVIDIIRTRVYNKATMNTVIMILLIILSVWSVILTWLYYRQQKFLISITQGISKKDLKTILHNISGTLKAVGKEIERIDGSIVNLQNEAAHHIQKIGFVRFNPYSDTGGDQSFCLCLLNENNDGVLFTSLHSREQTRIYAKPIAKGQSEGIQFSKEETDAYNQALHSYAIKFKKDLHS